MRSAPGPLFDWFVPRALRETSTFVAAVAFGLLFYAVVLVTVVVWASAAPLKGANARELLTAFHYEALIANGLVLLLWGPSRVAQALSREREVDTLSALRLTGLTGTELALGFLGGAVALPLVLFAITLPVVLLGAGGKCGVLGPPRAYAVLLLLALVYHLVGALVGLATKKAQNAGGTAVFVVIALLVLGGPYRAPYCEALGLFGPWGAALTTAPARDPLTFELPLFGASVPGDLVQVPVLALLALILLRALGRQLAGDRPAVIVGAPAALALAALGAGLVVATFEPSGEYQRAVTFARLVALAVVVTPLALEAPSRFMDLVRGASRRDADDPPFPEERLDPRRLLPAPLILALAVAVLAAQLPAEGGWRLRAGVGGLVLVFAWLFAALALQGARLYSRDRGAPLLMAGLGLALLWLGPFGASVGLRQLELDPALTELPRVVNPVYALFLACSRRSGGLDPVALALTCATLHAFGALGVGWLIRAGERRVTDLAASMVALPADADDAPGTLERRCENGHLFAAVWATCPHCPGAVSSPGPHGDSKRG